MLCQHCKQKEATTHIVRTVGNSTVETYLCSECANECGFKTDFSVSDFLFGGILSPNFLRSEEVRCPICNSSFKDISASGNVGCGKCYEVFSSKLMPTISNLHSFPLHKGKNPKLKTKQDASEDNTAAKSKPKTKRLSKEEKIAKLKAQQEEMIKCENFEKAAELRDKIKELEGGK